MKALPAEMIVKPAQTGAPSGARLLLAAASYIVIFAVSFLANAAPLPFDRHFWAVVYLMWSGNPESGRYILYISQGSAFVCAAACLLLFGSALVSIDRLPGPLSKVVRILYHYALALPLFFFLIANLGRYVANLIYYLAQPVTWDATPLFGRLETSLIEWLQYSLYSPTLSALCSVLYSIVWMIPLLTIGVGFVILHQPKAMSHAITGYFLISVLAIPVFVLLPVFDPWTTNPLYGNPGAWHSQIHYLYASPDLGSLQFINRQLKWATGSCLPSLHLAFPLMLCFIARRHNLRMLSLFFSALSILTAFTIVYLGRHWILDLVIAVPYTYFIVRLAERLDLNFILE